jgi:hypothetical protein
MRIKNYLAVVFLVGIGLAVLSGCALTDATLKMKYDANSLGTVEKLDSIPAITVKTFIDSRKVDDPKFVYYKNSNMGQTMGRLTSEDATVADFVTEVVRKTAENAGIKLVNDSEFVLSGKILSLDSRARIGFWNAAIDSTMHGELQLNKGSQIVRKESIVEKGKTENIQVATISDYEDSLQDLFKNLSATVLEFIKSTFAQIGNKD